MSWSGKYVESFFGCVHNVFSCRPLSKLDQTKHPTHNRHVLQSGSEPDQHLAMPFVPDQHHHGSTFQTGAVMIQHRFAQTPSHQSLFI